MYLSGVNQLSAPSQELRNLENPGILPSAFNPICGWTSASSKKHKAPAAGPVLSCLEAVQESERAWAASSTPKCIYNVCNLPDENPSHFGSSWQETGPNKLKIISNTNSWILAPFSF